MTTKMTPEQQALADAMSGISERIWCAGWMTGLEYYLWNLLACKPEWHDVADGELRVLRVLSNLVGGWVFFDDDEGETFVTTKEWEKMVEDWNK